MPTPETSFKEWSLNNLVKNTDRFLSNDWNLDKEELDHLNSDIKYLKDWYSIKTKEELKSFIKEQAEYKETVKEASKLNKYEIIEIQKYIWVKKVDWIFRIDTFIKFRNSNFWSILKYLKEKKESSECNERAIMKLQQLLKTKIDWKMWIKTYIEYKKLPISWTFTNIKECINSEKVDINEERLKKDYEEHNKNYTKKEIEKEEKERDKMLKKENLIDEKMWAHIKLFIEKFKKLKWVNKKNLAIILPYIRNPNARIQMDYHWKISIYNWKELVYNFSEIKSIKLITKEAIEKKDLELLRVQFWSMPKNERKSYVSDIKNIIRKYNHYSEARELFSQKIWENTFKINLSTTPALQKYITAWDLFWNKDYLIKNQEKFTNYWNWVFLNEYNQERLTIKNGDIIEIWTLKKENIPKKTKTTRNYNSVIGYDPVGQIDTINNIEKISLSKELWDWITKDWVEFQNPDEDGKCWFYTNELIEKFLETKEIRNAIKVDTERHWTNFNVILNNWYLNKDKKEWKLNQKDSFVSTYDWKETRQKDLKNNLNVWRVLDKRIKFEKIDIDFPKEAIPWDILVYKAWSSEWSGPRKKYWHVEIVWSDGMYYYNEGHNKAAWSASKVPQEWNPETYSKKTWFTWYAYRLTYSS